MAQLLGAAVGALLVVGSFGTAAVEVANLGAVAFGEGVGYPHAILAEAIATYLLVLAIYALAVDTRGPAGWAGLMIGLSVTCLVLVFGPVTGAAVNPARAFGPFAGAALTGGTAPWNQFPAYVVGSLLGALAAAFSYDLIARPRQHDVSGTEPQGTADDVVSRRT